MPTVAVRRAPGSPRLATAEVRRRADRMLAALGEAASDLSVLLVDDAEIERLNARHRRKRKPTDVLAFPMDDVATPPRGRARLLGDVVVSLDTAARHARERRHPLVVEVTHLLAHGLLHLLGWDHRTDEEEARMNEATADLVAAATHPQGPRHTPRRRLRDRA
ncbi:MAG: rRNA maturation RNase YbeY [Deltaproteobacteria bacterium]|nr:rRNA maturation RNase YbeY [Deltaproteobacteria bacterium]